MFVCQNETALHLHIHAPTEPFRLSLGRVSKHFEMTVFLHEEKKSTARLHVLGTPS